MGNTTDTAGYNTTFKWNKRPHLTEELDLCVQCDRLNRAAELQ
jgi:hypothetical protein